MLLAILHFNFDLSTLSSFNCFSIQPILPMEVRGVTALLVNGIKMTSNYELITSFIRC